MSFTTFCLLFLPVLISGLSVFVFKASEKTLKLITAFSGAFLLSISFLDIIPEIYDQSTTQLIGVFILIGFFIQLLLDFLTKGIEHGHQHDHSHSLFALIPILIGICIHSFLEGMPLSSNFNLPALQHTMLTGIIIHNIPISIVLMSLLLQAKISKTKAVIFLCIFAFSAPLGTLTSFFIGNVIVNLTFFIDLVMAMVVGIFLHISTTILFETDENHHFNTYKLLAILCGFLFSFLLL